MSKIWTNDKYGVTLYRHPDGDYVMVGRLWCVKRSSVSAAVAAMFGFEP